MSEFVKITVSAEVHKPIATVWESWTDPKHIVNWNFASDDWHCPSAENDIRTGGKFSAVMAAKDGSFSFEFGGVYSFVDAQKTIEYKMGDGRSVSIAFESKGNLTTVTETFDAETQNPVEMQKGGWQSIMNNFKKYTESLK